MFDISGSERFSASSVIGIYNWKLIQCDNKNAILLFNLLGFFSVGRSLKMMTKNCFSATGLGKLVVTNVGKNEELFHLNNQIIFRMLMFLYE